MVVVCSYAIHHYMTNISWLRSQEPLLYLDGSTVFLYAGLRIANKMKASVLTSRTEQ